jgi:hypothetical protein
MVPEIVFAVNLKDTAVKSKKRNNR